MIKIIAHQGGAGQWPGNSMTAFENVAKRPVDGVELDVHLTRDGEVVVLHDPAIWTSSGPEHASSLTASEIARARPNAGFAPLLRDVLPLFRDRTADFELQIDVKTDHHATRYPGILLKLADILATARLENTTVIASFLPSILGEAGNIMPGVRLRGGLTPLATEVLGGAKSAIEEYHTAGASIVDVNGLMLDRTIMGWLANLGIATGVAIANDDHQIRYWLAQPIQRMITDEPDTALSLRTSAENQKYD